MTLHVNIGDAKTHLSELLKKVHRGERVVITRAGTPEAELVPFERGVRLTRDQIAARRKAAFGIFSANYRGFDTSLEFLKSDTVDPDAKWDRTLDAAD